MEQTCSALNSKLAEMADSEAALEQKEARLNEAKDVASKAAAGACTTSADKSERLAHRVATLEERLDEAETSRALPPLPRAAAAAAAARDAAARRRRRRRASGRRRRSTSTRSRRRGRST